MLYRQTKVFFAVSLVVSSSLAYSYSPEQPQNNKRRGPPAFTQLDLNGDQVITLEEFQQHQLPHGEHQQLFSKIDSNGDQQISEQEHNDHKPPCPPRRKRQE